MASKNGNERSWDDPFALAFPNEEGGVVASKRTRITDEIRAERRQAEERVQASASMPKPRYVGTNPIKATEDREVARRRIANRQMGLALPSSRKRAIDRADPASLVPDERPQSIMFGGSDIQPEWLKDEPDPEVPEYIREFNRKAKWKGGWAQPPVDASDDDRRWSRNKAKKDQRRKRDWTRAVEERMYNENQSGASLAERMKLLEAMELGSVPVESPSSGSESSGDDKAEKHVDVTIDPFAKRSPVEKLLGDWRARKKKVEDSPPPQPEIDVEMLWWPDAVPHYLLEREGYYGIRQPKTCTLWWRQKAEVAAVKTSWWDEAPSDRRIAKLVVADCKTEQVSSSDPEIVDAPPD